MQLRTIGIVVRMGADIVQRWLRDGHDYVVFSCTSDKVKQLESQRAQIREQGESVHLDNFFEQSSRVCSCSDWEWKGGYCARSSGAYPET